MSFDQLKLHESILQAVAETGYTEPTPIQTRAIPMILKKQDVIGIAQTGTGKTAAFVLPILSNLCNRDSSEEAASTKVLMLAPTRELVNQICENIRTYGAHTAFNTLVVTGGVGEAKQIEAMGTGVQIVVATPGRLLELMERGHTRFDKVEYLVLDEADRMLDMGFLPAIDTIIQPLPKARQNLLFSATLSKPVEKLAKKFMTHPQLAEVDQRTNPADTVTQHVYPVDKHLKTRLLIRLLQDPEFFAVIVFVRTRVGADVLTSILRGEKILVATIHGDKSQNHRSRSIRDFAAAKIQVLVATDVAARGLDIQGVTHVINYDFPEENDEYIHRIGRTGRAGATGYAITFQTQYDGPKRLGLEKHIHLTLGEKRIPGFDYSAEAEEDARQKIPARGKNRNSASKYSRSNRPERDPDPLRSKGSGTSKSKSGKKAAAKPAKTSAGKKAAKASGRSKSGSRKSGTKSSKPSSKKGGSKFKRVGKSKSDRRGPRNKKTNKKRT